MLNRTKSPKTAFSLLKLTGVFKSLCDRPTRDLSFKGAVRRFDCNNKAVLKGNWLENNIVNEA